MKLCFFKTVLFFIFFIRTSKSAKCGNKANAKEVIMEGSKNVPVLLLTGKLNRNVRLPCSYCNEKIGISGRKWRKRSLHGNVSDIVLDMHDNPSKNRIFVNSDHSLSIKKVRKEDGGYYFCYDIEDIHGKARMDILLDVVYRTTLVPKEINKVADLEKEVAKWSKPCENLKSIPAVSTFECYPEWGAWSKCDKCDQIGQRKRVGECRLQRFVKAKMKTPEGKVIKSNFPVVGIGCHSYLLDKVPRAKTILSRMPNLVLFDKCKVKCVVQVTKPPSKLDKLMKDSFLNKIRIKVMKKLKEVSVNVSSETRKGSEGSSITLFCPGATLDMRVKWKYKERPLKADRLKARTLGRMTIDATDALHINELRVTDAGEYTCTLYDVEIGILRLKVISRHAVFDPTTNFGILTLTLLFGFLLWIVLMSVRWKNFRMQRRVQQMRNRRKELPEEETEDTESHLSLVNEETSLTTRTETDI